MSGINSAAGENGGRMENPLKEDKASLTRLITEYMPIVKAKSSKYRGYGMEADDLFQEGMIGLLSAIEHYDAGIGTPFSAYARVCIENRILTAVKSAGRLKNEPLNNYVSIDEADLNTSHLQDAYEAREQVLNVKEQINSNLSKLEREVLMLFLNGFSYEQIGDKLSISPKSVDNSLQRVRRKLKD